jgi:hypothetical protein
MSSAIASRITKLVTPYLRPRTSRSAKWFLARIFACPQIPLGPYGGPHFVGEVSGLGAAEAERHTLTEPEVEQIVRTEAAERQAAAHDYDQAGRPDEAERLTREASVLMSVIDRSEAP